MKYSIFLVGVLLSLNSIAQTVTKIQDAEAMVTLEGNENLTVGERVHFLNQNLDTAGEGEVTKLSAGGKKALVKVLAGKIQPGMTLEKKNNQKKSAGQEGVNYTSLNEADRQTLMRGEMSTARYVVGGILGTYPLGLGIGHAVQGRYSEKGWIFTVGEVSSLVVALAGLGDCFDDHYDNTHRNCSGGLLLLGAIGYFGFRIWEIVDVWATPLEQDRQYRELKSRLPASEVTFQPGFIPLADGGALGLRVTF